MAIIPSCQKSQNYLDKSNLLEKFYPIVSDDNSQEAKQTPLPSIESVCSALNRSHFPQYLKDAMSILFNAKILTQSNFDDLARYDNELRDILNIFKTADKVNLVTQDFFHHVISLDTTSLIDLSKAFNSLTLNICNDKAILTAVINSKSPLSLSAAFAAVDLANILTGNIETLIRYDTAKLGEAFEILEKYNLLNQKNFDTITNSKHSKEQPSPMRENPLLSALKELDKVKLVNQQLFNILMGYTAEPGVFALAMGIKILKDNDLLSNFYLTLLFRNPFTYEFAHALVELKNLNLLKKEYIEKLYYAENPTTYIFDLKKTS